MIPVDGHIVPLDLGNQDGLLALIALGFQLHADLKLVSPFDLIGGHDDDLRGVVEAISFGRVHRDLEGVASFSPLHRLLQTPHDLTLAMEVGERPPL